LRTPVNSAAVQSWVGSPATLHGLSLAPEGWFCEGFNSPAGSNLQGAQQCKCSLPTR
jgi:hypothetical protein